MWLRILRSSSKRAGPGWPYPSRTASESSSVSRICSWSSRSSVISDSIEARRASWKPKAAATDAARSANATTSRPRVPNERPAPRAWPSSLALLELTMGSPRSPGVVHP